MFSKLKNISYKKVTSKNDKNFRYNLGTYIWLGFNYSCNVTFVLVFSQFILGNSVGVGYNILWIFLIDGALALICSFAYMELVKHHRKVNGGAYVFVRASAGRFWGFFIAASQYLVLPATLISTIVGLIRRSFLSSAETTTSINAIGWGPGASLYLDLIGIALFILITMAILFGLKWLRRYLFVTLYLRWIMVVVIVGFAIAAIVTHSGIGFSMVAKHTSLTYSGFNEVLTSSFFFFIGFESFAAISQHLKNPSRTVPRGMVLIIGLVSLFYISMTILMIGSLYNAFGSNPYLNLFSKHNFNTTVNALGIAIILITILTTKVNFITQLTFYSTSGGMYPLAKENYVPIRLAKKSNRGVFSNAVWLNVILILIVSVFFLIIPDIFVWVNNIKPQDNPFNFATLIGMATVMLLITYVVVILLAMWLRIGHQKPIPNWHMGLYAVGLIISMFIILNFFGGNIGRLATARGAQAITLQAIQLGYFAAVFIFIPIWYYSYYHPIYKRRLIESPELQKRLDAEYRLLDYTNKLEAAIKITDIPQNTKHRMKKANEMTAHYELKEETHVDFYQEQQEQKYDRTTN